MAPSRGGRLWQNGRFARSYDKLGPCLGSGGMGSVWACRVSDDPVLDEGESVGYGYVGSWVAVKAIVLALPHGADLRDAAGELHSGLRECLSTFRDLSPKHVVRYDSYWLEEPAQMPPELRRFIDLGPRAFAEKPLPGANKTAEVAGGGSQLDAPHDAAIPEEEEAAWKERDSVNSVAEHCALSLDLREAERESLGSPTPVQPGNSTRQRTSTLGSSFFGREESCALDSCGFVWERRASTSASEEPKSVPASPCHRAAAALQQRGEGPSQEAAQAPERVVLLIEMELMGEPPDGPREDGEQRSTLRSWLQRPGRTLSDAADVFYLMMMSVRHIHRKRIIHADLKPDNIFISEARSQVTAVRIGDFGLAGENQQGRQFCYGVLRNSRITGGTPGYAAPEILLGRDSQVCPSDKVDIFACAVILLELLLTPFRTHMERVKILHAFHLQKAVPDYINTRLPKTRMLLQEMGELDPTMRLGAEEVCKRFEKEVKKELRRSTCQSCCDPSGGPSMSNAEQAAERAVANGKGGDGDCIKCNDGSVAAGPQAGEKGKRQAQRKSHRKGGKRG